jgi:hypothetical protein
MQTIKTIIIHHQFLRKSPSPSITMIIPTQPPDSTPQILPRDDQNTRYNEIMHGIQTATPTPNGQLSNSSNTALGYGIPIAVFLFIAGIFGTVIYYTRRNAKRRQQEQKALQREQAKIVEEEQISGQPPKYGQVPREPEVPPEVHIHTGHAQMIYIHHGMQSLPAYEAAAAGSMVQVGAHNTTTSAMGVDSTPGSMATGSRTTGHMDSTGGCDSSSGGDSSTK